MTPPKAVVQKVDSTVRKVLGGGPVLLAVSGGLDSMVLLESAAGSKCDVLVATFDHGTGDFASAAVNLVARRAAALGFPCVIGRASGRFTREHEWRKARLDFLRETAAPDRRVIVTAHNRDDQIETVFMRILRNAGPRGMSGLFAESAVLRPLLSFSRSELAHYVTERGISYLDDPSNSAPIHMRNRVRHEILPALRVVRPSIDADLLEIARKSADWRQKMDVVAEVLAPEPLKRGELRVERDRLRTYDATSLRVIWPAIAARASVVMDRRGTQRAAEFTINGMTGGSIQLSGGVEIVMRRDHMLLRRWLQQK